MITINLYFFFPNLKKKQTNRNIWKKYLGFSNSKDSESTQTFG
jgi:hypothetical protein